MSIPKIIHYCWFGGKPLPKSCKKLITTWEKHLPDYELRFWDEESFDVHSSEFVRAAYQAGVAFSKSYVGYVHAVAHSLGGAYGIPHGLANAVLLPHVLFAYGKRVEKKLHRLASAAGIATAGDTPKEAAERLISEIFRMNREMQIPATLQGIVAEDIPALARRAEKEANPLYPVPKLLTAKELERFYYAVSEQQSHV